MIPTFERARVRRALWLGVLVLGLGAGVAGSAEAQQGGLESVKPTSAADAYYERGARALRQGNTDEALKQLATAARLAPEDPSILAAYAQALIGAGRQDEAVALLKQARGTKSVDEDLALGVVSYELKRYDDAERHLRSAVQRDPKNGAAHLFLASALIELGRLDEAEAQLTQAREDDEWLGAEVESRLGQIELKRNNRAAAEAHFREAERLAPNTLLGHMAQRTVGKPDKRRLNFYTSLGIAYDSNVNLGGEDPNFSPDSRDDGRGFVELGLDYDLIQGDKFNLRVGGNGFVSRHFHDNDREFDLYQGRLFAIGAYRLSRQFTVDTRYTFEYIWNNLNSFRRTNLVEPSLRWQPRQDLLTRVLYRWEDRAFFPTTAPFPVRALPEEFQDPRRLDPLNRTGTIQIAGIEQYWFYPDFLGWGRGFLRASYRFRSEDTEGGDASARGSVVNITIGQPLPWQFYFLMEGEFDRRRYSQVSSVGLLTEDETSRRLDEIWSARFVLRRPLTEHLTAETSYRFIHWGSNVQFYDYTRHIVDVLVTYRY